MVGLTFAQRRTLGNLIRATGPLEARKLHTRSDVLWRLEECGFVRQNIHGQWSIRSAGRAAYDEAMRRLTEANP